MSSWEFLEQAAPSTPSSGRVRLYAKTDGLLYSKDDAGAETALSGGASLPVVDTTGIAKGSVDPTKIVRLEVDGLTTGTTRVLTVPDADLTIVGTTTTQTLTNKTLTAPIISTISNTGTVTLPTSTDTLVGRATTDTLTNKTLTAPIISSISNTGTLTLPTSTDTLVGRATTDTLTNKTMAYSSNTFTGFPVAAKYAIIRDQRASTTQGGASSTTTWNARTLQTEHYDPDGLVTISSNKFVLTSGDYILCGWAMVVRDAALSLTARLRLYNVTGAAAVSYGTNISAGNNAQADTYLPAIWCKFTSNGTDEYRFDTYSSTAKATNGLGAPLSLASIDEVYLEAILFKVS